MVFDIFGDFQMKANKTPAQLGFVSVSSFKDAAYQTAVSTERMASIAQYILDNCPGFLDEVPKEIKAQLDEGFALRWQELNPAVEYNAEWVPASGGGNLATLAFCMSYSQQVFGQMKNENPVQHGVIKNIRDKFNKYRHNKMNDLKTAVRRLLNDGKTSTRKQAANYDDWLNDALDTIKARAKTAAARNDATADEAKARAAVDAFKRCYFS